MLDEGFKEFCNEILLEADTTGELQATAFFRLYSSAAIENGDIENLDHCPVRFEGARRYRIDGYHLNTEQGELTLGICDYRTGLELKPLNASDAEIFYAQAFRLFEKSADPDFINELEDSSPTFEAAYLIHQNLPLIKRVRIVLFSNARISIRKKLVTKQEVNGRNIAFSILDFERYIGIQNSRTGSELIEIDFRENGLAPLPCLKASTSTDEYASYLVVLPGKVLGEIYGLYGARLLEANVRTFLQAKTKVNKGIIRTVKDEPYNFFAFNNGLTATASDVVLQTGKNSLEILSLRNLQIVNGGQTTASILYARDKEKASLDDVYVQMKLSVVESDSIERIVPLISRYANTQNKVSEADFFSSHPFHVHIEKLSRRISAPPKEGALIATKWFYERARGQYKDKQAYKSDAVNRKFRAEYPKEQMLVKTDLSKYEMSFAQKPHIVSQGAQKCFIQFAAIIDKQWNEEASAYGDNYFRDAMSRALVFRWTDKMVGTSEWYISDRGHKAPIVTYTIAVLAHLLEAYKITLDLRKIWNSQKLPASLQKFLKELAPEVADLIKDAPETVRNIGEYSKRQFCWSRVQAAFEYDVAHKLLDCTVSKEKAKELKKEDRKTRKIDHGIDAQSRVVELKDKWKGIAAFGLQSGCKLTYAEMKALEVCCRIPSRLPNSKESQYALKALDKIIEEGYEL
jgi:hypothetical protein